MKWHQRFYYFLFDPNYHCQNCYYGNNDNGCYRKNNIWFIYCYKRKKYLKWDTHKWCFTESLKNTQLRFPIFSRYCKKCDSKLSLKQAIYYFFHAECARWCDNCIKEEEYMEDW